MVVQLSHVLDTGFEQRGAGLIPIWLVDAVGSVRVNKHVQVLGAGIPQHDSAPQGAVESRSREHHFNVATKT
jgi:hypothetical protein